MISGECLREMDNPRRRKKEMNENNKKVLTQYEKVLFAMYVRIYWSVLIQNKLQLKELVVLKFCNQLTQFRFFKWHLNWETDCSNSDCRTF